MHYLKIVVGDDETGQEVEKKFIDGEKEIVLLGVESETFTRVVVDMIHKLEEK